MSEPKERYILPRTGRPPKSPTGVARTAKLYFYLTPLEAERVSEAAQAAGKNRSDYIRGVLLEVTP